MAPSRVSGGAPRRPGVTETSTHLPRLISFLFLISGAALLPGSGHAQKICYLPNGKRAGQNYVACNATESVSICCDAGAGTDCLDTHACMRRDWDNTGISQDGCTDLAWRGCLKYCPIDSATGEYIITLCDRTPTNEEVYCCGSDQSCCRDPNNLKTDIPYWTARSLVGVSTRFRTVGGLATIGSSSSSSSTTSVPTGGSSTTTTGGAGSPSSTGGGSASQDGDESKGEAGGGGGVDKTLAIGLGVGIPLGVALIGALVYLVLMKRKMKKQGLGDDGPVGAQTGEQQPPPEHMQYEKPFGGFVPGSAMQPGVHEMSTQSSHQQHLSMLSELSGDTAFQMHEMSPVSGDHQRYSGQQTY